MSITHDHLERLKTAVLRRGSMASLADWVTKNTLIGGKPYSYTDHEYQEAILSDTSQEVVVRKCSQVGVSEASARLAIAMVNVVRPFTAIYCLPTASFAATFMRTRIDPIIYGSKTLKDSVHKTNDNAEVKQFGDSFLYMKGAATTNAPISIPADVIISDETDFSSQDVLSQYASRLTHSKWKLLRKFSTPTVPNYGVDKAFKGSRRFFNLCKCHHCNHWFLPDYYKHVHIPGYKRPLVDISKTDLGRIKWREAVLLCPSCHREPSLQKEHREYVCENPDSNFIAAGYQVSPFDAPNIIKVSDLIKTSTDYLRLNDFVNFSLGLPMQDAESTLLPEDFDDVFVDDCSSGFVNVMGIDVGNTYHIAVGATDAHGNVFIHRVEKVPMAQFRQRYRELRNMYRPLATVIDSGPHAETVMALQNEDKNLFAAVYSRSKNMLTHTLVDRTSDPSSGTEFLRQVTVNRNRAFDVYMEYLRSGALKVRRNELMDEIVAQHTSMKRVKQYDPESGEMTFAWQKTDGNDHFHHTFLYLWLASRIRGVTKPQINLNPFAVHTFRVRNGV